MLWPEGKALIEPDQVEPDGWLGMKYPWYRDPALDLSDGYGDTGFQASGGLFSD